MKESALTNPMDDKVVFGLWLYILSDCVLFAGLFATYVVQQSQVFGGPTPAQLFNLQNAFIETILLLTSSFTVGLAVLAAHKGKKNLTLAALCATFILGLSFVAMELSEFHDLLAAGHSWQQSGFLSSFFTLVGTHGLHVSLGLLWMLVLIVHVYMRGISPGNWRKLLALSVFWHFLDIVWVGIYTFVYLFGLM